LRQTFVKVPKVLQHYNQVECIWTCIYGNIGNPPTSQCSPLFDPWIVESNQIIWEISLCINHRAMKWNWKWWGHLCLFWESGTQTVTKWHDEKLAKHSSNSTWMGIKLLWGGFEQNLSNKLKMMARYIQSLTCKGRGSL
jgi:hypothetical protein